MGSVVDKLSTCCWFRWERYTLKPSPTLRSAHDSAQRADRAAAAQRAHGWRSAHAPVEPQHAQAQRHKDEVDHLRGGPDLPVHQQRGHEVGAQPLPRLSQRLALEHGHHCEENGGECCATRHAQHEDGEWRGGTSAHAWPRARRTGRHERLIDGHFQHGALGARHRDALEEVEPVMEDCTERRGRGTLASGAGAGAVPGPTKTVPKRPAERHGMPARGGGQTEQGRSLQAYPCGPLAASRTAARSAQAPTERLRTRDVTNTVQARDLLGVCVISLLDQLARGHERAGSDGLGGVRPRVQQVQVAVPHATRHEFPG